MAIQNLYYMSALAAVTPWPLQALLRNQWMRKNVWSYTETFRAMDNVYAVGISLDLFMGFYYSYLRSI